MSTCARSLAHSTPSSFVCMRAFVHSFIHSFIHSLIHLSFHDRPTASWAPLLPRFAFVSEEGCVSFVCVFVLGSVFRYRFNDSRVSQISEADLDGVSAYLLFYVLREAPKPLRVRGSPTATASGRHGKQPRADGAVPTKGRSNL